MMTDSQKSRAIVALAIIAIPFVIVLGVKAGHPTAVWFYCGILRLC